MSTLITIPTTMPSSTSFPRHPLEPLSAEEVRAAVGLLKRSGKVTPTTRFVSVALKEPHKSFVHGSIGDRLPRARRLPYCSTTPPTACYEATLSLTDGVLLDWKHVPGVQPTMTIDEQVECEQAVLASPEFKAALKKHTGVDDTSLVMVDIWSAGNYGAEEDRTRRLARPLCFLRTDPTDNGYVRPIEGLRPVVDLNTMQVIRVEEYGHWPLAAGRGQLRRRPGWPIQRNDIKPLEINQPEGPSFEVEGHQVRWQKWSFVIGFNAREGLTLHHLRYNDEGRDRSILYRASLTEMVVPYGDPGATQRRKNAFDVGEYGMGMCANSLELGCDCLGLIHYFDAHLCDSRGEPLTIKNAICMHEEDYGILWKHTDRRLPDEPAGPALAAAGRLVDLDGRELRVRLLLVSLPGRQHPVRGQAHRHPLAGRATRRARSRPTASSSPRSSTRRIISTSSTCGSTSTSTASPTPSTRIDVVADPSDDANPFENAFQAVATPLETEKQARGHLNLETVRTWKIVNPERARTPSASRSATSSCPATTRSRWPRPNAWWRKRAGFVNHHVWVTPYRPDETVRRGRLSQPERRRRRPDRAGPSRTARSRTPTSSSGTPSATPTSRARKITRSCPRPTSASRSSPTASSRPTRPTTCPRRRRRRQAAATDRP